MARFAVGRGKGRLITRRVFIQIAVRQSRNRVGRFIVRAICLGNQSQWQEERTGRRVPGGFGDRQLPPIFPLLVARIDRGPNHQRGSRCDATADNPSTGVVCAVLR